MLVRDGQNDGDVTAPRYLPLRNNSTWEKYFPLRYSTLCSKCYMGLIQSGQTQGGVLRDNEGESVIRMHVGILAQENVCVGKGTCTHPLRRDTEFAKSMIIGLLYKHRTTIHASDYYTCIGLLYKHQTTIQSSDLL